MNDFEEYEEEQQKQPLDPNIRKQLREAEKDRKELETVRAELEAQKREVQFSKAGIPESGVGSLFRKAYDGSADADSIRKAAEEYGILQTSEMEVEQINSNAAELDALRRAQGATIGTSGALPDPGQEFLSRIQSATTPEEVLEFVKQASSSNPELGLWTSRSAF